MNENTLPPAAIAALDQMEAETLALVRIGRNGVADVKRFHMSRSALAAALREIADGLGVLATRERGEDR